MDVMDSIREQVEGNSVILYMKGSPSQPQCGFSATAVQALIDCRQRFAYVDVLSNPEIRANLPKYGDWPTFPQLWVAGELVGGSDIVSEMHKSGELKQLIDGVIDGWIDPWINPSIADQLIHWSVSRSVRRSIAASFD